MNTGLSVACPTFILAGTGRADGRLRRVMLVSTHLEKNIGFCSVIIGCPEK